MDNGRENMSKRELNTKENVRTVTSNQFITACGLEGISLKARKLLYIAVSQCRKKDTEFYEYEITVQEFSELMGIATTHVYQEADAITDELMRGFVKIQQKGNKSWRKYQLFDMCEYTNTGSIRFEISKQMTDFLLNLTGNFSQPLLHDFLKMRSPYSMAVWHLMQREMKSKQLGITATTGFDLTLKELRQVTGTEDKFKSISHFKQKVLDKAIREIFDCAGVKITYQNIKIGRSVTGFRFFAEGVGHIDLNRIPLAEQERIKINAARLKNGEYIL